MLKSWILWGKSLELYRNGLWRQRNNICFAVFVLSLHLLGILFPIHGSLSLCHLLGDVLGKLLVPKAVLCSHNMVGVGIFSCVVWLRNCWQEESAPITSNTWWKVKTGEDVRLLKFIPVQFCWICISWGLWIPGQHLWDDCLVFATPGLAWHQAVKQSSSRTFSVTWNLDSRHIELQGKFCARRLCLSKKTTLILKRSLTCALRGKHAKVTWVPELFLMDSSECV